MTDIESKIFQYLIGIHNTKKNYKIEKLIDEDIKIRKLYNKQKENLQKIKSISLYQAPERVLDNILIEINRLEKNKKEKQQINLGNAVFSFNNFLKVYLKRIFFSLKEFNDNWFFKPIIASLFVIFISILVVLFNIYDEPYSAKILNQKGNVSFLKNNHWFPLKHSFILKAKSSIKTAKNSNLDIDFGKKRIVRLKPETQISIIEQFKDNYNNITTKIRLDTGVLYINVNHLLKKEKFVILCHKSLISIVGTEFSVYFQKDILTVKCFSGKIIVQPEDKKPQFITTNEKIIISKDIFKETIKKYEIQEKFEIQSLSLTNSTINQTGNFRIGIKQQSTKRASQKKASVFFRQARKFLNTGEYNKALLYYKKYVEIGNDQRLLAESYFRIGKIYQYFAGDYNLAVKNFKIVIDKYPNTEFACQSMFQMGECFIKQENVNASEKLYNSIINKMP